MKGTGRISTLLLTSVFLFFFGTASPAFAHAGLVSTTPVDGAVLDAAPAVVTFVFNEELLASAVNVSITNEAGAVVAKDIAESAGTEVTVPWPADLADGTYVVSYRVVSNDGHPITGDLSLTYGAPLSEAAPVSAAPESPAAEAIEIDAVVEPVVIESSGEESSSDSPVTAVLTGLVIAGALITALVVWNRRRA